MRSINRLKKRIEGLNREKRKDNQDQIPERMRRRRRKRRKTLEREREVERDRETGSQRLLSRTSVPGSTKETTTSQAISFLQPCGFSLDSSRKGKELATCYSCKTRFLDACKILDPYLFSYTVSRS